MPTELTPAQLRKEVRRLLANYMISEGCSCCQNTELHDKAKNELGKLLRVKKHKGETSYNFYQYKDSNP